MRKYDNQLEDFFGLTASSGDGDKSIRDSLARQMSWKTRLRLLPKVLSPRERGWVLALFVIGVVALAAIPVSAYYHFTEAAPADGGWLVEGVVGEPRLVNPLLAQVNDPDRDLSSLVYSGLYRYDGQGKLRPDLAKTMPEITSDGLSYSVALRDDAKWHDGVPVTADDIVFTVQAAQNADYGAPLNVRAAWQGVTVEKAAERVVIFRLKNKYAQFPGNLTLGILPKHLWQDVRPINFNLSELNLKPVGSGPFRFSSLIKNDLGSIRSYKLEANDQYYGGRPHLDGIEFRFFGSEDELIEAFNGNDVDNIGFISGANADRLKFKSRIELEQLKMPRYYAAFMNQNQSKALADKNVRLALNHATDRVSIINETLDGNAFLINSPLMGGILDINPNVRAYDFDKEQAEAVLEAGGWKKGEDGIRRRGNEALEIRITTSTWPELAAVAHMLQEQWEEIGAKVTVETLPITQLQQSIRDRSYQILLFGEIMGPDPDPYPLWHSSQREGGGQNLALYSNATADRLLEEARGTLNPLERREKYDEFQKVLIEDIPAVLLYSPHQLYGLDDGVGGFNTDFVALPSDRFTNVADWYLKTERKFK